MIPNHIREFVMPLRRVDGLLISTMAVGPLRVLPAYLIYCLHILQRCYQEEDY